MRPSLLLTAVALAAATLDAGVAADTQFAGQCAMSVAAGTPVATDCSINWISPEDKLYCFTSVAARDAFVANAPRNQQLAEAFWRDPAFWEQLRKQQ